MSKAIERVENITGRERRQRYTADDLDPLDARPSSYLDISRDGVPAEVSQGWRLAEMLNSCSTLAMSDCRQGLWAYLAEQRAVASSGR